MAELKTSKRGESLEADVPCSYREEVRIDRMEVAMAGVCL